MANDQIIKVYGTEYLREPYEQAQALMEKARAGAERLRKTGTTLELVKHDSSERLAGL